MRPASNTISKKTVERPSLRGCREALQRIRACFPETPLVHSEGLSRALKADVWIKNETVSPIASFKWRGAWTALMRAGSVRGVVTSSTGNHGQGVAYAAREAGIVSHIFLPQGANPIKRSMIEALGGGIREIPGDIDTAKAAARAFARERNFLFVDDGESLGVLEGAGTVGLEVAEQLDSIDAIFIPMGSGSLAGGCGVAVKALQPKARVYAVQSRGSRAMADSFHAHRPIPRSVCTVADGLVCREPAELALGALVDFVDDAILVSDRQLLAAVHAMSAYAHVLVEPSGAAGLAGAWLRRKELQGRRVVLVLTGANILMEVLRRALATPSLLKP